MEQTGIDPALRPAIFDLVRTVSLFELWRGHGLLDASELRRGRILPWVLRAHKATEAVQSQVVADRSPVLYIRRVQCVDNDREAITVEGDSMPRGREKDRKVRKKHRKNVARVKALAKTRRAAAKKAKRG